MSDTNLVQKLREITGAGVMDCKKALNDAKNDIEKAKALIMERGLAKVEKRAGRETGAGMVKAYVHNDRIGVIVELRAETDFVVRSDPFQELAREVAMQISATAPENVEALLKQPYIRDESKTVEQVIGEVIARVGENIRIASFARLSA
ncbi:MAG: translation elongation factor Ts [Patescibacteria group bacterium]